MTKWKLLTVRIFPSREAGELCRKQTGSVWNKMLGDKDDCGGMVSESNGSGRRAMCHVLAADPRSANTLLDTQSSPAEIDRIETEAVTSSPRETTPLKTLALGQIISGLVIVWIISRDIRFVCFTNGPTRWEQKHAIITPVTAYAMKHGFITMDNSSNS